MLERSSSGSDSECSLGQEEEIWDTSADDSSTEDNDTRTANEVVIAICIFLNFFQLFFRTSEKAILALLAFIRILFTFLGRINPLGQQLNTEVALLLPRSIQTIRKLLRQEILKLESMLSVRDEMHCTA